MSDLDVIKSELAYVRQELARLGRDHSRLLIALSPVHVCMNSACQTGEVVPHMLDERDHRTYGEVARERRAAEAAAPVGSPFILVKSCDLEPQLVCEHRQSKPCPIYGCPQVKEKNL